MIKYSIIIPVYNRPDELKELLFSLNQQHEKNFQVIVIDDGSIVQSKDVVKQFSNTLAISYYYVENMGQGFARNFGMSKAKGSFFIFTDSDCVFPKHYMAHLDQCIQKDNILWYGGPDLGKKAASITAKAIDYAMTSLLSTGGMRGGKFKLSKFYPRSFNMGFDRKIYDKTKGFIITDKAEDIEMSLRIEKLGFKKSYIPICYVWHQRRKYFIDFYKQIFFFGQGRISLKRYHKNQYKIIHAFPIFYLLYLFSCVFMVLLYPQPLLKLIYILPIVLYSLMIFLDALLYFASIPIALLSIWAVQVQMTAYSLGQVQEYFSKKH